jgi:hypothetical protein
MRRLIDTLLIVVVLLLVGLGAYKIGQKVDNESNKLSSQDPELTRTTAAATTTKESKSNRTPVIIGVALGGAAVLIVLGSVASAAMRSRKRERWRAG